MAKRHVVVRAAAPEDCDVVYEFYSINNDLNVLPRPAEDFRRSADNGLFFIGEEGDQTMAVAGAFDLNDTSYMELGGTLIDPSIRGFGLQNIVNNLVSGLILMFERPMQIGDTIEVGSLIGRVQRISARSSTIRTYTGAEVIVPNANLVGNEVVN